LIGAGGGATGGGGGGGGGGGAACGAGAGGCLVFLARPGRDFDVTEALRGAGGTILKFTFAEEGVAAWESLER